MTRVPHERGIAVLVVLVVLAIGALAGTVALLAARSAGEGASVTAGRLQSRLTMRSGVLALEQMALEQRDAVLGGAPFEVETPLEIFTVGNRTGMFRLDARITEAPVSLDALLDVNTADAEMLAKLPGMDETLAAAIVAALPVMSLRELLAVEGVTVELLYGEYDGGGRLVSEGVPLASVLTLGSVDPGLTVGVGGVEPGLKRLRFDGERDEGFRSGLVELVGEESAELCMAMLEVLPTQPPTRRAIAAWSSQGGLDQGSTWLDAMDVGEGPVAGRIDINRAPVEVLAAIPGFSQEVAERIEDFRVSASADEIASVIWPLEQGLVDEEGMSAAVDRVTTRSVRWVLRAEAGMASVRERSVGIDSLEDARRARAGMAADDSDTLADRVAMDLLVDFSGPRPIIVPLGEVSLAGELAAVARVLAGSGDPDERATAGDRP